MSRKLVTMNNPVDGLLSNPYGRDDASGGRQALVRPSTGWLVLLEIERSYIGQECNHACALDGKRYFTLMFSAGA